MSKKEKKEPVDLKEISGGYMAVDRDKAFQANLELIRSLAKNLAEKMAETKAESNKTDETGTSSKKAKK